MCCDEFKSTRYNKGSISFIYCDYPTGNVIDVVENIHLPFLKRYWKLFLKADDLLDYVDFTKRIHFPEAFAFELYVVQRYLDIYDILENTYYCYQSIRSDIEHRDFEMFKKHLLSFKDNESDRMKISIETCLSNTDLIENSFV